jgi:hypothetical protein
MTYDDDDDDTFCILIVDNASIKVLHKGITASTMEWK